MQPRTKQQPPTGAANDPAGHFVNESNPTVQLTHALLIWTAEKGRTEPGHASLHKVLDGVIQPTPKPLTLKQLRSVNDTLQSAADRTEKQREIEIYPDRLLYADSNSALTVWWRKGRPTPQFFQCEELGGQVQGVCAMPSMVFMQRGSSLFIAAFKGNERPHVHTQLFHAPLFNTYEETRVCLGGVHLEPVNSFDAIENNETAFLRGINTHANGRHRKCGYEHGLYAMWRDLLANPSMVWNDDWLVPTEFDLGNWIKEDL